MSESQASPLSENTQRISTLLKDLQAEITQRVALAQQVDVLTGLPNRLTLDADIEYALSLNQREMWIAFLEIDNFKAINTKFGYDHADLLLKDIADCLRLGTQKYFMDGAKAYRAHGDEFYLSGTLQSPAQANLIETALDAVRATLASIALKVGNQRMSCTASVGWLTLQDITHLGSLDVRRVKQSLEEPVEAVKWQGGNRILRYSSDAHRQKVISDRRRCAQCHATYSVNVPQEHIQTHLRCPNCGLAAEPLAMALNVVPEIVPLTIVPPAEA